MQGLGSGAISLAGTEAQKRQWLPKVAAGNAIAAFALSEPEAGSDVGAMRCAAREDGDAYVLDGEKTWISNGGIADVYVVFARSDAAAKGAKGISAFIVEAGTPGFEIAARIDVIAPHPLARLRFADCRVPKANRIGADGEGFKVAMRTLDVFRTSVAAAALGFARRALDEALHRTDHPADVRPDPGPPAAGPGQARRDGDDDRRQRAARLPRRLAARPGPRRHQGSGDGQDGRHRRRAAGHRRGGAALRRPGRGERRDGGKALPRDPGAAHLRGRYRGAAAHHRPRAAQGHGQEGDPHDG
jgi:alkylation response protein AidB-like acyl-CoA dehydrogenase